MNKVRAIVYNLFPKKMRITLGKSKLLQPFRDALFRSKGSYREISTDIKRQYANYTSEFKFFASIQVATKAKERGIENTILKHSITLLKEHKPSKKDNYTVFDVGTNFGFLSLVWATTICKNGRVFSFEPHPFLYKSYLNSVKKNNLTHIVHPENLAIGNQEGTIEVNLRSTTANVLKFDDKKKSEVTKSVTMTTLDYYIEKNNIKTCDLIKIDVDGIELDILNGSKNLINKFRPIFIVETNDDEKILDFFIKMSYDILNMNLEPIYKGELPPNIFCVPK